MNRMVIKSRVGADGVLSVSVPIGVADAHRGVQVIIEPDEPRLLDANEYSEWLRSLSGRWRGTFERPPQGTLEEREPLS